jgi:hypothetical protein
MNINDFENLILAELKSVTEKILSTNPDLSISAKTRAGAEISELLEEQFVIETQEHKYFRNAQSSPKGATKNPWDARASFYLNGHEELIWIDFKAIKVSSKDSNPDIGTPDKIIDLINLGYFYLVYIFVYYEETENGLKFVKNNAGELVKLYFLKDISSTFRRNPKNQLQVNISAKPEKRSREAFIRILFKKITESHKRQIAKSEKVLKEINESGIEDKLLEENTKQEQRIKKI